jgi:hypothetical protein
MATCEPEFKDRLKVDWPAGSLRLLSALGDSTGELLGSWRGAREQWTWTAGLMRDGLDASQLGEQRAFQADS